MKDQPVLIYYKTALDASLKRLFYVHNLSVPHVYHNGLRSVQMEKQLWIPYGLLLKVQSIGLIKFISNSVEIPTCECAIIANFTLLIIDSKLFKE